MQSLRSALLYLIRACLQNLTVGLLAFALHALHHTSTHLHASLSFDSGRLRPPQAVTSSKSPVLTSNTNPRVPRLTFSGNRSLSRTERTSARTLSSRSSYAPNVALSSSARRCGARCASTARTSASLKRAAPQSAHCPSAPPDSRACNGKNERRLHVKGGGSCDEEDHAPVCCTIMTSAMGANAVIPAMTRSKGPMRPPVVR